MYTSKVKRLDIAWQRYEFLGDFYIGDFISSFPNCLEFRSACGLSGDYNNFQIFERRFDFEITLSRVSGSSRLRSASVEILYPSEDLNRVLCRAFPTSGKDHLPVLSLFVTDRCNFDPIEFLRTPIRPACLLDFSRLSTLNWPSFGPRHGDTHLCPSTPTNTQISGRGNME